MDSIQISYDDALDQVEAEMHNIGTKEFELGDFLCNGMYVRAIFANAGDQLISKVHKVEHPYFLMAGTIEIISQEGKEIISAPFINVTLAGTRRYARCLSDVLFVTVHRTDKQTTEEIEAEVIIKRDNQLLMNKEELF